MVLSDLVFEVTDIVSKWKEFVHAKRKLLYRTGMDVKEVDQKILEHAQYFGETYQVANTLHGIKDGCTSR